MRKKWCLFRATEFQSLMYPCFTICRIFGIFPYKINAATFEYSKRHYIISSVIVCICCVFVLILIHDIITSKLNFGNEENIDLVMYSTFHSLITVITHVLSSPRMCLLQNIMEISSKLSSESYQKLSRLIHAKDILGIIFVTVLIGSFIDRIKVYQTSYVSLVIIFASYLSMLTFQLNMLYVNCVCVLKACFKSINDNLIQMHRHMINDIKLCGALSICYIQKNQFLLIELKILKKRHLMVSDTVQRLNTIFSLQLLITIVMITLDMSFSLYLFAVHWQNGTILISLESDLVEVCILSLGYDIIIITLLVWTCETGKNQAQEISATVHDLLNRTNNKQIKNELHLFSLQILHRKNIFSIKGLNVNAELLVTIVGKITTYLVILVQFLHISHSCDRKTAINVT
ncbi:uncharacterized protein LOC105830573 [Monomorium pharaonis]|uniref:uncharacterized protein LOC105830573 n=1 Tax=Monomorium pharaonis TaxID=307658 RepID=UPI00102E1025|nr:uncharacterized protein LOC105830573 [Monomorium pharaonis]